MPARQADASSAICPIVATEIAFNAKPLNRIAGHRSIPAVHVESSGYPLRIKTQIGKSCKDFRRWKTFDTVSSALS